MNQAPSAIRRHFPLHPSTRTRSSAEYRAVRYSYRIDTYSYSDSRYSGGSNSAVENCECAPYGTPYECGFLCDPCLDIAYRTRTRLLLVAGGYFGTHSKPTASRRRTGRSDTA
eukprot:scaffold418745_cov19-Prasinocladus_malaysianus.AAC.1